MLEVIFIDRAINPNALTWSVMAESVALRIGLPLDQLLPGTVLMGSAHRIVAVWRGNNPRQVRGAHGAAVEYYLHDLQFASWSLTVTGETLTYGVNPKASMPCVKLHLPVVGHVSASFAVAYLNLTGKATPSNLTALRKP